MKVAPVLSFDLDPSVKQFIVFSIYGLGLTLCICCLSWISVIKLFGILCVWINFSLGMGSSAKSSTICFIAYVCPFLHSGSPSFGLKMLVCFSLV